MENTMLQLVSTRKEKEGKMADCMRYFQRCTKDDIGGPQWILMKADYKTYAEEIAAIDLEILELKLNAI